MRPGACSSPALPAVSRAASLDPPRLGSPRRAPSRQRAGRGGGARSSARSAGEPHRTRGAGVTCLGPRPGVQQSDLRPPVAARPAAHHLPQEQPHAPSGRAAGAAGRPEQQEPGLHGAGVSPATVWGSGRAVSRAAGGQEALRAESAGNSFPRRRGLCGLGPGPRGRRRRPAAGRDGGAARGAELGRAGRPGLRALDSRASPRPHPWPGSPGPPSDPPRSRGRPGVQGTRRVRAFDGVTSHVPTKSPFAD